MHALRGAVGGPCRSAEGFRRSFSGPQPSSGVLGRPLRWVDILASSSNSAQGLLGRIGCPWGTPWGFLGGPGNSLGGGFGVPLGVLGVLGAPAGSTCQRGAGMCFPCGFEHIIRRLWGAAWDGPSRGGGPMCRPVRAVPRAGFRSHFRSHLTLRSHFGHTPGCGPDVVFSLENRRF